jgi:hypothetical protein
MEELNDLGLELLMNPKKRNGDNMSIISSRSGGNQDAMSIRSVDMRQNNANIVDVGEHLRDERNMRNMREEQDSERSFTEESFTEGDVESGSFDDEVVSERSFVKRDDSRYRERERVDDGYQRSARVSEEDVMNMKREYLYQFDRLAKRGITIPRQFTMASSLEEMKQELERLKRDKEVDGAIRFQRKTMMTVVSGIELLNNFFDPVGAKLDGWSETLNENIDDYDDIFEELHEKYRGKAKMAPELKLLFMLGGSAFMFHLSNSLVKSSQMPGLDQVLKENPELAKQFAAATANSMHKNQSNPMMSGLGGMLGSMFGGGGGGGGLGGMLGSMFGGGGGGMGMNNIGNAASAGYSQSPQPRKPMKGPSNIDDIFNEMNIDLNTSNDDRVEMFSTVTDSELSDLTGFNDDQSINNLLMNTKKSKRGRGKGITLDI